MKTSNNLKTRKGGCLFSLVKLAILTVIVLAVAAYFTMGFIVDYALKTVTSGTSIDAGVSSVSLSISEQKLEVNNFYITNPPNFKKCNAIEFKDAILDADIEFSEVLAKKLITLDEIKVVGLKMEVDVKMGSGFSMSSNLTEIKNELAKKYGSTTKAEGGKTSTTTAPKQETATGDQWKIIIKKIVFDEGVINGTFNSDAKTVKLPSFSLENIGVDKGGATPSEAVAEIVGQLSSMATQQIIKENVKGDVKSGSNDTKAAVGNVLKSIFKKN